ncbi:hypothetical protein ACS0TY_001133 [Phlomoides rotata]
MEDESSGPPPDGIRSQTKVLVGEKRESDEVEETSEKSEKRVKMRDPESVFRSEAEAGRGGSKTAYSDSRSLDLNVGVDSITCMVNDDDPICVDESNNPPISGKKETKLKAGLTKAKRFNLDLNAADISSSINDPFNHPYKMNEHLKYRDDSDCGSSIDPLERDPMSVWKGLKQNNFMSTRSAVPMAIPKARGRKKSNQDVVMNKKIELAMNKKIELAKKKQVDIFARVAAPSGLLDQLNPGIINHVRNSKQVHSIIESLVRSERRENLVSRSKKYGQNKSGTLEREDTRSLRVNRDVLLGRKEMIDYTLFSKLPRTEVEMRAFSMVPSQFENKNEDYRLPLKPSSSFPAASQNASCLSDKSADLSTVTSLSSKAANVASQWLELLNQDIKGRLAALRRSRKRVRQVINTDLPLLISSEFSSNIDKDLHTSKSSTLCHFDQATADAHSVKWNNVFAQMDKALSEEESNLDNWLSQVKEMQLHCEFGLNQNSLFLSSLQTAPIGNNSSSGATDNLEKDLAVRAAAASIYSTCNFLLSRENLPCH